MICVLLNPHRGYILITNVTLQLRVSATNHVSIFIILRKLFTIRDSLCCVCSERKQRAVSQHKLRDPSTQLLMMATAELLVVASHRLGIV
jgi:hypothetical protein